MAGSSFFMDPNVEKIFILQRETMKGRMSVSDRFEHPGSTQTCTILQCLTQLF